MAKSSFKPGLYSLFLVPVHPREDVSMDFLLPCLTLKGVKMLSCDGEHIFQDGAFCCLPQE